MLVNIPNALALVWFWRIIASDIGSYLTDRLTVNPLYGQLCGIRDRYLYPLRNGKQNVVGKPEIQFKSPPLERRLETHPLNLQIFLETGTHTNNHVIN